MSKEKGAYMDYLNFSKKEWEILICFWNAQEPLCCSDFSERFNLNRNTSLSVIRKLAKKDPTYRIARNVSRKTNFLSAVHKSDLFFVGSLWTSKITDGLLALKALVFWQ